MVLVALFVQAGGLKVYAQEQTHWIDCWEEKCLEKGRHTTYAMTTCAQKATELWQKEVQKLYDTLLNALPAHLKQYFVSSQKAWEEYVRKAREFEGKLYSEQEGTMWGPVGEVSYKDYYRERYFKLRWWLDVIRGNLEEFFEGVPCDE